MISFVFLSFICLMQASYIGAANTVPVFLIDYEQVMHHVQIDPNPFAKLTSDAFANIVQDSEKRCAGIIIFVEETFSAEEISTKDRKYGTPYKHLHASLLANTEKVKYLPSVIEPYEQLKRIFTPKKNNVFILSQRSKLKLQDNFKYIYVFFDDGVSESKTDVLKRHDAIIKKVVDAVRQLKPGPVVAYYTGKSNPIVVQKVEFIKDLPTVYAENKGIFIASPRAIFRLFGVTLATATRRSDFNRPPSISEETYTRHALTTKFAYAEFELEWKFSFKKDVWLLVRSTDFDFYFVGGMTNDSCSKQLSNEEVGHADLNIQAEYNTSYFCPEPIRILNSRDGSTITINQIHVEPKVQLKKNVVEFSRIVHCAPYFSAGILTGLMITFLCLGITMFGVLAIFDVSSNDRFDDPNGEPLSHEIGHLDV